MFIPIGFGSPSSHLAIHPTSSFIIPSLTASRSPIEARRRSGGRGMVLNRGSGPLGQQQNGGRASPQANQRPPQWCRWSARTRSSGGVACCIRLALVVATGVTPVFPIWVSRSPVSYSSRMRMLIRSIGLRQPVSLGTRTYVWKPYPVSVNSRALPSTAELVDRVRST